MKKIYLLIQDMRTKLDDSTMEFKWLNKLTINLSDDDFLKRLKLIKGDIGSTIFCNQFSRPAFVVYGETASHILTEDFKSEIKLFLEQLK